MADSRLHIDFETRSFADLRKTGVHVYAEDPTTDVWCAAYAFDDGPVELWTPDDFPPLDIFKHVNDGGVLVAHNANFERVLWQFVLGPRYGWPVPKVTQWRCTMAMARAMSLPGSLENAAAAVGMSDAKDMAGHRLMMQMARPRKVHGNGRIEWWDVEEKKERLYAYCKQDVIVERNLEKRLLPLSETEQRLWFFDQVINDRGVHVDKKLCDAAKQIVKDTREALNAEMREVTNRDVTACTNVNQIVTWLRSNGLPDVESINKSVLAELLSRDDISADVRRVLELRQEASKASVAKIDALLRGRSNDGRARGLVEYHVASTGRWGGRRFQPQNLKRPEEKDVDAVIKTVLTGRRDLVEMIYGAPLSAIGDCLRGMVVAAKGKKLITADYSNIEGRVLAWLAGEQWKLDAFREYDAGTGPDLYKLAYSRSFNTPIGAVDGEKRQVGKVQELALGFGGGVGAFVQMAKGYGVDIGESYDMLLEIAEQEHVAKAFEAFEERGKTYGIEKRKWVAAEIVKLGWRAVHPNVQQFWWSIESAAVAAVERPGEITSAGLVKFRMNGSFLFMLLPSRRMLCYPYPKIKTTVTPWGAEKPILWFKGVDTYTRQWGDTHTYGGKLAENATQAVARDVLAEAIPVVEKAGYPVVLTVHDEMVTEVPKNFGSVAELSELMTAPRPWATGLPITADGWSGDRYRKG